MVSPHPSAVLAGQVAAARDLRGLRRRANRTGTLVFPAILLPPFRDSLAAYTAVAVCIPQLSALASAQPVTEEAEVGWARRPVPVESERGLGASEEVESDASVGEELVVQQLGEEVQALYRQYRFEQADSMEHHEA